MAQGDQDSAAAPSDRVRRPAGIGRREITKDVLQQSAEAAATTAATVTGIVFGAVRDVIGEVGGLATELFEIKDAADRAEQDERADDH